MKKHDLQALIHRGESSGYDCNSGLWWVVYKYVGVQKQLSLGTASGITGSVDLLGFPL